MNTSECRIFAFLKACDANNIDFSLALSLVMEAFPNPVEQSIVSAQAQLPNPDCGCSLCEHLRSR